MDSRVMGVIEEQVAVKFTGKVNLLSATTRQFLGHVLFKDGDVIQVRFQGHQGLKAFYQLLIQEYTLQAFAYVVEPEVVDEKERQIHYPFSVLKSKLPEVLKQYRESLKLRPPGQVKVVPDPEFIRNSTPVTNLEFEVLETLTEWNKVDDVYQHCKLLDHEITLAMVSLRKKGALKIVSAKNNP